MNDLPTIKVSRLLSVDQTKLEQISSLIPQLTQDFQPLTLEQLSDIVHSDANIIHVAIDERTDRIVGIAQLVVVRQLTSTKCWIEDMVVSNDYRKLGIGRLLMQAILEAAPKETRSINLTSKPDRESAHRLYAELGFKTRDTVVFRLMPNA